VSVTDHLSLGEGSTPVLELGSLAQRCDVPGIWAKAEWLNPTGSYKDRIALETVRDAVRRGDRGWVGTSSGNGGASMSAYGARAGLRGLLCVAADAPREKVQSIIPYGTTLLAMSQLGVAEMDEIGRLAAQYRLKLAVTAYRYNPEGMAGAEAIGTEIAEQGSFTHVYVPTGGGGLLVAVARGLARGLARGASTRPRIICAQPSGCAPIVGYLDDELSEPCVDECATSISGLQLATPPDGLLAAAAVTASGGWGCHVSDEDAWAAQSLLAQHEGVFVEPASALAVAAIMHDVRTGRLTGTDRPLAVLTGTGLKDLRRFSPTDEHGARSSDLADLRQLLASTYGHSP
jgi:threonine synthase